MYDIWCDMQYNTQYMVWYAKGVTMKNFSNHNDIEELIVSAFDKIKTIVDANTIIGEKLETKDGTFIIPISKVTVGYVVGGGEYADLSARRG